MTVVLPLRVWSFVCSVERAAPLLVAALFLAATLSWSDREAAAQSGPSVTLADENGSARSASASGLLARAAQQGQLPLIVKIAADFALDDTLSESGAAEQRQALSSAQASVLGRLGPVQGLTRFETVPYLALTAGPQQIRQLLADPQVVEIHEDIPVPPALRQSTGFINAKRVWRQTHRGRRVRGQGQVVAVLDTGTQLGHRAFRNAIVSQACRSSTVPGTSTSLCPGGRQSVNGGRSGRNCPARVRGCDHGTHVAGIAMGNAGPVKGVAPASKLISIQVFSRFNSAASCGGVAPCVLSYTSDQMAALERVFALRNRFRIAAVNMSLGGGYYTSACNSDPRKAIIDRLRAAGIATVIAAGNNGYTGAISAPACIGSAIAVGSTERTSNSISFFSNHSRLVKLMAPGSNIEAPILGNRIGIKSGTSMAAPHVAGAWALLKSARPNASVIQVLRVLRQSGVRTSRGGIMKKRINLLGAFRRLTR